MSSSSQDTDIMSSSSQEIPYEEIELATNNFAAMSLDDYAEILEIPYEEIESATNNFADENFLTQGSSFKVYKCLFRQSQSSDLVSIVARKSSKDNILVNEMIISKDIKHKNIVSTFRIAANEEEGIIINKHEANGSLDKHLSGPTLTWLQRLHICVKVAVALKYLHYDAEKDHYIIHGNIKSSKILLDHNWEPKLHGFGFAVKVKKHHPHFPSIYEGTLQYMDPAYENNKALTHKSDVFSFGVLLFEILFGEEASIQNDDNWYFTRLARSHYEGGTLDDLISSDLRKQMNLQSFNIFTKTAYLCLKEQWSERPDMNQVLSQLGKALELQQKHECPRAVGAESTSFNHLKGMLQETSLNHLKFRLSDIHLATNNFSDTCCIGSGGYGKVYKAELEHFDGINLSVVEGKNKGELPKKHSIVAIKRILDNQGQQGFFAEIEILIKCRHPNIVSLLGFCDEGSEMLLVYEYLSNGSLDDYLGNTGNMTNLTWAQRIQICLDIAHGLNYLHTITEDKPCIIHRDIKSANILLDVNWVAKIADFGLSKLHHACQQCATALTNNIAGTSFYLDPEYVSTGKLKTESDIYSFGVVLFEIMCGNLAYDKVYNKRGLPSFARHHFNKGNLKKLVDPKLMEVYENMPILTGGVNQNSLDTFSEVAYQCLAVKQSERPTMDVIIKQLVNALNFQKTSNDNLCISLNALKLATQNFSDYKCIGDGRFWKLYEGELVADANGCTPVLAKRWDRNSSHGRRLFLRELAVLLEYRHENIVALVGYCNEMDENIIVYEHASHGRLDKHLDNPSLTWMQRLKIGIDVAKGLRFLHKDGEDGLMHRDIKSGSILLDGDWNAKISNFELSCKIDSYSRAEHFDDNDRNSLGYIDPQYEDLGYLRAQSDIYSLGVILVEMLCGRLAWLEGCEYRSESLGSLAVIHYYYENRNLDEMIFEPIKEQIVPESLTGFVDIALECLKDEWDFRPTKGKVLEHLIKEQTVPPESELWTGLVDFFQCLVDACSDLRPSASKVVEHLTMALEFQEDCEIWKPKLPIDYEEMRPTYSKTNISTKYKKAFYDMFSKGILLQDGKMLFTLGGNGERNEMISARTFSYKNRMSYRWQCVRESRFHEVAEIFDISKMKIQIKITTQFLSPHVNYGAYIIFKFCDTKKFSSKPLYVNLKYKKGREKLHAYFATWRDDEWMMIELSRFFSDKKDTNYEVLLESFSRYYCGKGPIYIEGIEFRVIDNIVKNEEIEEVQQILKSNSNKDQLNEVNRKKHLMLSPMDVVYGASFMRPFQLGFSGEGRFYSVLEQLPHQIFRINCKIQSQMLSPDTEYLCYLLFELSEKCRGLHCPVKVRDLLHRNNKEAEIIYFRSPLSPWNLHENNSVPRQREDGCKEVKVWKFNSNHQLKNDCIPVNLKFITYEGTMSGLILIGLELRPM